MPTVDLLSALLWALSLAAFAGAAVALMSGRRAARRSRYLSAQLLELEHRLGELVEGRQALERKLERASWEIERLAERGRRPPPVAPPPASAAPSSAAAGYAQAIKLARRGESAQTLIEVCELSRAEAELLLKLHGRSSKRADT